MKRFLFTLLVMTGAVNLLNAQFHYTEKSPTGVVLVDGWYNTDPQLLATDSKDVIAQKMAAVHKVGTWMYYFETGKLAIEEHYTTAGNPEGTWKQWYADGTLSQDINYTTGKAVFYHANGTKAEAGMMKGFIRVGKWEGWHENGKVNFVGNYDAQGNKDGEWLIYDNAGNLMSKEVYSKGKFVSAGR